MNCELYLKSHCLPMELWRFRRGGRRAVDVVHDNRAHGGLKLSVNQCGAHAGVVVSWNWM